MTNEIYLVGNLFELLAKVQYFEKILGRKVSKWIVALVWIGVFVIDAFAERYVNLIGNTVVYILLMLGSILFLYESSVKKKMIAILIISAFQLVAEVLTNAVISFVGGSLEADQAYRIGYMISKIIFFIFIRIAIHFSKRKTEYNMGTNTFVSIVFVPMLTLILTILFEFTYLDMLDHSSYNVLFYAIILVVNYLTVIQYDDVQKMLYLNNKNRLLEEQKIYYVQQYEQTKQSWEMIRSMRHNMKNEYISESILLRNGEYEKLDKIYHERIGELEESKLVSQSGNIYIDAVVNYKVSLIIDMGAVFECKILVPVKIGIEDDDIVLVLGNLLDNVRDAFGNRNLKEKIGSLVLTYEKSNLYIEVKNTYEGERKKNLREEYVTTKSDEAIHGIGMKAIKSVVKKYNGYMEIKEENGQFIISIMLQV